MNEGEARRAISTAGQAKAFIEHPVMAQAFASAREELIYAWENSRPTDTEGREHAYRMIKMLDRVRQHIAKAIDDGRVAEADLRFKETQRG